MNAQTRKSIMKLINEMENTHANLEIVRDDEQEKFDNMPESFQNGERGEKMQSGIDAIESAMDDLQTAMDTLMESIG